MPFASRQPRPTSFAARRRAARRDGGFTLPELLITISIMGTLVAVMSSAVLVMLKTTPQAELRLAESKDITFLQTWVPVDLSSAINSYDDPDDAVVKASLAAQVPPITYLADLPGTNVLTLVVPDLTTGEYKIISYRYMLSDGEWILARFRITNPGVPGTGLASEKVSPVGVAHEVPGPPADGSWTPPPTDGSAYTPQKPIHAFEVTSRNQVVLRPIGENVTVKFESGNVFSTGGAGMSAEKDLTPNDPITLPDPTAPPSRCGGRLAIVLDTSYSIPGFDGGSELEAAAASLIDAFQGTPTTLTVMGFDAIAYSMYPNLNGTRGEYFSLLNPSNDINNAKHNILALPNVDTPYISYNQFADPDGSDYRTPKGQGRNNAGNTGPGLEVGWTQNRTSEAGVIVTGGGTNWEDALHAPFFNQAGNLRPVTPETVILITDGDPNTNRNVRLGTPSTGLSSLAAAAAAANRGRATGARIIGVLVGGGNTGTLESNLAAVVGGNKWNGSVNSATNEIDIGNAVAADYFSSHFDQLGLVLRSIMAAQCGGTVTVQKAIDGGTPTGQWNYSTDTGGATLDLNLAGSITFDYLFATGVTSRDVVITEEVKDGFVFDRAECFSQGVPIVDPTKIRPNADGSPGVTLTIQPDQAVSCTMYSDPE